MILFVWVATAAAAVDFIADFNFPRTECLQGSFQNLQLNDAQCNKDGNGVFGNTEANRHLVSSGPLNFSAADLTIELWMVTSGLDSPAVRPLVSYSRTESTGFAAACRDLTGFRLSEEGDGGLVFEYNYDDGNEQFCTEVLTGRNLMTAGEYVHVALVLGRDLNVYVNGSLAYDFKNFLGFSRRTGDPLFLNDQLFQHWDDFRLQLFSDAYSRAVGASSDASIYLLRLHSRQLDSNQIKEAYRANIPNSPPVVRDSHVLLNEDGEAGPGGLLDPEVYATELPLWALARIPLDAVDIDDSETHPNYKRDDYVRTHPMRIFLARRGVLEVMTQAGGILAEGDEIFPDQDHNFFVLVRPPLDLHEGLFNFTFRAIDGVTGVKSTNDAIVNVKIVSVNDPPIMASKNIEAFARTTTLVEFEGRDVEKDDIVGAYIESLPREGVLRSVLPNGTLMDRALVVGDFVPATNVAYKFIGGYAPATDVFSVSLVDAFGAVGAAANVSVAVKSNIATEPTNTQRVLENEKGVVQLYAVDKSDDKVDVCLEIVDAYPSETTTLFHADGSSLASGNQTLPNGTLLLLSTSFNTPKTRWDESPIDVENCYVVYFAHDCNFPEIRSPNATQQVAVLNVAERANVSVTPAEFSIYALSADTGDDGNYPTLLNLANEAVVSLTDLDRDVDALRVSITCDSGLVSLSRDSLHLADFNSQEYCRSRGGGSDTEERSPWYCKGSGSDDRTMTFVATPSNAETLLSRLTFKSFEAKVDAIVTIRVYDGAGGDCLAKSQFKTFSLRRSCGVSESSIVVHVKEFAALAAANDAGDSAISWQLFLAFATIILFFLCCCCCYVRLRCRSRRRQRSRKRRRAEPTTNNKYGNKEMSGRNVTTRDARPQFEDNETDNNVPMFTPFDDSDYS